MPAHKLTETESGLPLYNSPKKNHALAIYLTGETSASTIAKIIKANRSTVAHWFPEFKAVIASRHLNAATIVTQDTATDYAKLNERVLKSTETLVQKLEMAANYIDPYAINPKDIKDFADALEKLHKVSYISTGKEQSDQRNLATAPRTQHVMSIQGYLSSSADHKREVTQVIDIQPVTPD